MNPRNAHSAAISPAGNNLGHPASSPSGRPSETSSPSYSSTDDEEAEDSDEFESRLEAAAAAPPPSTYYPPAPLYTVEHPTEESSISPGRHCACCVDLCWTLAGILLLPPILSLLLLALIPLLLYLCLAYALRKLRRLRRGLRQDGNFSPPSRPLNIAELAWVGSRGGALVARLDIVSQSPPASPLSVPALRAIVRRHIGGLPRMCQRLADSSSYSWLQPLVDGEVALDVDAHVTEIKPALDGSSRQLARYMSRCAQRPFRVGAPPWEILYQPVLPDTKNNW